MNTKKAALDLDLPEPGLEPAVVRAEIRGKIYSFTELEIGEYDKLVKQVTSTSTDPDTGEEVETVDNTLLMRLMLRKCITPTPPSDFLLKAGTRMYRAMARIINDLHYGDEPVKIINDDDDESPEGNPPKGNE